MTSLRKEIASLCALSLCLLVSGCSVSRSSPSLPQAQPVAGQTTTLTVMSSATASDRLSSYITRFSSLALTSQSGKVVPLLATEQSMEFLHSGGNIEPVLTAIVPQDVYTAMSGTISLAQVVHLTKDGTGADIDYNGALDPVPAFSFADPITVSGTAMAIRLDLQASASVTLSTSEAQNVSGISPTFKVTPIVDAAAPSGPSDGAVVEMDGRVSNLSSEGFLLTLAPDGDQVASSSAPQAGVALPVLVDAATGFEGISSFGALAANTFIDADLAFLPDGTVHARRVEVDDAAATNISIGPLFFASQQYQDFDLLALQQQGDTFTTLFSNYIAYAFKAEPSFHVSRRFTNLASLPFTPVFDQNTFSVGQRIAAFSGAITTSQDLATSPTTLTLEPQTINGTVTAVSTQGEFTLYTVALDASDLISVFGGPSTVTIYVDSALPMQQQPPGIGSLLRARGLLFNDHGTYRLDTEWIASGVTP